MSLQIGCCGADGPNDYMHLRQPLPLECRDSVTGNAFFNGCVDELIWYLEDKSVWVAVLGMTLALLHVSNPKRIEKFYGEKLKTGINFRFIFVLPFSLS